MAREAINVLAEPISVPAQFQNAPDILPHFGLVMTTRYTCCMLCARSVAHLASEAFALKLLQIPWATEAIEPQPDHVASARVLHGIPRIDERDLGNPCRKRPQWEAGRWQLRQEPEPEQDPAAFLTFFVKKEPTSQIRGGRLGWRIDGHSAAGPHPNGVASALELTFKCLKR